VGGGAIEYLGLSKQDCFLGESDAKETIKNVGCEKKESRQNRKKSNRSGKNT